MCTGILTIYASCQWKPEEGIWSPNPGVTESVVSHYVEELQMLLTTTEPSPQPLYCNIVNINIIFSKCHNITQPSQPWALVWLGWSVPHVFFIVTIDCDPLISVKSLHYLRVYSTWFPGKAPVFFSDRNLREKMQGYSLWKMNLGPFFTSFSLWSVSVPHGFRP